MEQTQTLPVKAMLLSQQLAQCLEICICRGDSLEAFNIEPHGFGGRGLL